jgi:hypothetical protein
VFEAEKRRIQAENDLIESAQKYKEKLASSKNNIVGESLVYDISPVYSGEEILKLIFISKDGERPNRELTDNIYTYTWFGSEAIIFSQQKKGIYYYNVNTGEKLTIEEDGSKNYKIVGLEGNVLKYDNEEVIINY